MMRAMIRAVMRLSLPLLTVLSLLSCHVRLNAQESQEVSMHTRKEKGSLQLSGLKSKPGSMALPYYYYRRGPVARPTIFFLSGGPGQSNLGWTPPESWLQDFDVVLLEYRGVGRSSITLKSSHFRRAILTPVARMALSETSAISELIGNGFADLQGQGIDLNEFAVTELADDIERLRNQLGLPEIYLVGHSFGTRVALWYQTRYRQYARASVLFSLNTPGGFIWYPQDTKRVWQRYRDDKLQKNPAQAQTLNLVLDADTPRHDRFSFLKINDTHALTVAFFLSFNAATRDRAFDAMAAASRGETGNWSLMAWSYQLIAYFGFNWADFFVKAYSADCDPHAIALADAQANQSPFQSPSSILFSGCAGFSAAGGTSSPSNFVPDYQKTLAIVGEFDPSTPIERKPAGLPDARFVVIGNAGHADVLYADPAGSARWLRSFFLGANDSTISSFDY